MSSIYLFSGPCGSGKTTLANTYAAHLIRAGGRKQVYVIHGDDFHKGFVETQERVGASCRPFFYWPDILAFNWECIIHTAEQVLRGGIDVIIDYVVEDELPLVCSLAKRHGARLYYVVLTASRETLRQRLTERGNPELTDRALYLKEKLEQMQENQGHLYDNTVPVPESERLERIMASFEKTV